MFIVQIKANHDGSPEFFSKKFDRRPFLVDNVFEMPHITIGTLSSSIYRFSLEDIESPFCIYKSSKERKNEFLIFELSSDHS